MTGLSDRVGIVSDAFAARTPRERRLILGCAVLLTGALAWQAFWSPLLERQAALADRLSRLDRAVAVLDGVPLAEAVPQDTRPLNVVLTETASVAGLVIRRLEPEGAQMRMTLEEAPFDAILLWLERLERESAIRLDSAEIARRPAPGVVSATLVVGR